MDIQDLFHYKPNIEDVTPEQINLVREVNVLLGMHPELDLEDLLTVLALVASKYLYMSGNEPEQVEYNLKSFLHTVQFATSLHDHDNLFSNEH